MVSEFNNKASLRSVASLRKLPNLPVPRPKKGELLALLGLDDGPPAPPSALSRFEMFENLCVTDTEARRTRHMSAYDKLRDKDDVKSPPEQSKGVDFDSMI